MSEQKQQHAWFRMEPQELAEILKTGSGGLTVSESDERLERYGLASTAIVYLAPDAAKFVTGSELVIDGGYTCR